MYFFHPLDPSSIGGLCVCHSFVRLRFFHCIGMKSTAWYTSKLKQPKNHLVCMWGMKAGENDHKKRVGKLVDSIRCDNMSVGATYETYTTRGHIQRDRKVYWTMCQWECENIAEQRMSWKKEEGERAPRQQKKLLEHFHRSDLYWLYWVFAQFHEMNKYDCNKILAIRWMCTTTMHTYQKRVAYNKIEWNAVVIRPKYRDFFRCCCCWPPPTPKLL